MPGPRSKGPSRPLAPRTERLGVGQLPEYVTFVTAFGRRPNVTAS